MRYKSNTSRPISQKSLKNVHENFLQSTLFAKSGIELTLRLRKRALASILRQDMSFFDDLNNSTAALSSRLGVDAARVQGCTGARLGIIIKNFSSLGENLIILG